MEWVQRKTKHGFLVGCGKKEKFLAQQSLVFVACNRPTKLGVNNKAGFIFHDNLGGSDVCVMGIDQIRFGVCASAAPTPVHIKSYLIGAEKPLLCIQQLLRPLPSLRSLRACPPLPGAHSPAGIANRLDKQDEHTRGATGHVRRWRRPERSPSEDGPSPYFEARETTTGRKGESRLVTLTFLLFGRHKI